MTHRPDNHPDPKGPPRPPEDFELVYDSDPLPPFYAAEIIRPYSGRMVWAADSAGRTRCGIVVEVPRVREDARDAKPVLFEDEDPLYLRKIVAIAVYKPKPGAR